MRRITVNMLPGAQSAFSFDLVSRFKALVGGLGSGKTEAGVATALLLGSMNAPLPGVFVEPNFGLIETVALPAFEKLLIENSLPYDYHGSKHILTVGRGRSAFPIYMRSGSVPKSIVGWNGAWGVIDEPGVQTREVLNKVSQRCRHLGAKVRQIALTGTPEGLNWFYEICQAKPLKDKNGKQIISVYRAKTSDNPFLPDEYLDNLRALHTEAELDAYTNGLFVNLTSGRCYPSWDRTRHSRKCANPIDGEMVVGCDFNVAKMSFLFGRRLGDELHVFDELIGYNTNTYRQADATIDRLREIFTACSRPGEYLQLERLIARIRCHTDASGSARKTSANESDLQILMGKGFWVVSAEANPPVRDRVYSVEQRFRGPGEHGTGTPRLYIDEERCPELCRSLDGQVWAPDGQPEKRVGLEDLSGPNDALGYMVWGFGDWRATVPTGNRVAWQPYQ